jgi:hypothetical protein
MLKQTDEMASAVDDLKVVMLAEVAAIEERREIGLRQATMGQRWLEIGTNTAPTINRFWMLMGEWLPAGFSHAGERRRAAQARVLCFQGLHQTDPETQGNLYSWCGREDSNFHEVTPTSTSSLRVYHSATTAPW